MKHLVAIFLLFFGSLSLYAGNTVRVLSYNVENLFDYKKDSVKNDASFTPEGDHYWDYNKYQRKLVNLSQAITAAGGWEGAAVIGLYEVENDYVLDGLTKYSPLKKRGYKYVHYESLDPRGIDVALLYDPSRVQILKSAPIKPFCKNKTMRSRDILYVKALVLKSDTVHFFLCHTPSRIGGAEKTEWKRNCVMGMVRQKADSINAHADANIIIMGDFNDYPDDVSISKVLGALKPYDEDYGGYVYGDFYYNMFWLFQEQGKGSYKYQGEWNMLDQIIVSGNLLIDKSKGLHTTQGDAHIFDEDFLLEDDTKYSGSKPFRTYNGRRYVGGYSDHLPIYLDLKKLK